MSSGSEDSFVNTMGIHGVPVKCECGRNSVIKTSKTKTNPGRPFFRCPTYRNDHLFKWVEDAVYEEVEDTLVKVESFESDISKAKVEIECIKNVNDELMEEVRKAKIELKRLSLAMKVGFGIVCLLIVLCIVMMMIEKSFGLYLSSY
ncbi:hypothetical protein V5N11_035219 [Cardamine amara subsp. amara]|uniref:GRF-type domain-containing protein n=1 Tax=Cardamine amara subsp. amara TaxID=228776 RepID=A0ABD1BLV6_CARAN